eukprot:Pgem_evm1s4976
MDNSSVISNSNSKSSTTAGYTQFKFTDNIEDSKTHKCQGNCGRYPSQNYPGETKRLYCKQCKLPGMVDVKNKRCAGENCYKYPNYNYKGNTTRLYCNLCKFEGMVNISYYNYKKPKNKTLKEQTTENNKPSTMMKKTKSSNGLSKVTSHKTYAAANFRRSSSENNINDFSSDLNLVQSRSEILFTDLRKQEFDIDINSLTRTTSVDFGMHSIAHIL